MKLTLSPSCELSDEHSQSSYGQPVLVNRQNGAAYGPGDIVQPYPSWGGMTAAAEVSRMRQQGQELSEAEGAFIDKFTRWHRETRVTGNSRRNKRVLGA